MGVCQCKQHKKETDNVNDNDNDNETVLNTKSIKEKLVWQGI